LTSTDPPRREAAFGRALAHEVAAVGLEVREQVAALHAPSQKSLANPVRPGLQVARERDGTTHLGHVG